jgi:hypothetical protein
MGSEATEGRGKPSPYKKKKVYMGSEATEGRGKPSPYKKKKETLL